MQPRQHGRKQDLCRSLERRFSMCSQEGAVFSGSNAFLKSVLAIATKYGNYEETDT